MLGGEYSIASTRLQSLFRPQYISFIYIFHNNILAFIGLFDIK